MFFETFVDNLSYAFTDSLSNLMFRSNCCRKIFKLNRNSKQSSTSELSYS